MALVARSGILKGCLSQERWDKIRGRLRKCHEGGCPVIGLKVRLSAKDRALTVFIKQGDAAKPSAKVLSDLVKRHQHAAAHRAFDLNVIPKVAMIFAQRFDQQVVGGVLHGLSTAKECQPLTKNSSSSSM